MPLKKILSQRKTFTGFPLPYGSTVDAQGTNFSLFSRNASGVTLVLFSDTSEDAVAEEIELDPEINRTGHIWHVWVEGISERQLYGYRVDGPYFPEQGHRFNRNKLLLDPYTRAVTGNFNWNIADARGYESHSGSGFSTKDSAAGAPKCIVLSPNRETIRRMPETPFEDLIIYEMHVRGFTVHPSSGVHHAGSYIGLSEKIPYLKELGVTAVELLPIHEFDENELHTINPLTGEKLKNYWGYSSLSFFAPRGRYSSSGALGEQVIEFREMVRRFHEAGIEVILDVVFNHTAEGDQRGPTLCFRGIDNAVYYMLENDRRNYKNYSGCGNTFNCNYPLVRDFIMDCLRYWVIEMDIDGFRFDLASVLGRDQSGNILANPPLIEHIEADPVLAGTKIIAEAWDAAGAYQVGTFPGRWAEWNGKFRDDVRRFWRGDSGSVGNFATRITGSSDLYRNSLRTPLHSINFVTSHDGFTLNDLVSFNNKHNEANGESNRDGDNNNFSYNYGIEGSIVTPYIEKTRRRQIKNILTTLLLSHGIPMILAGDEMRRTQMGNNNAYCQDNEISWLDWSLLEKHNDIFSFVQKLIAFRKNHTVIRRKRFTVATNFVDPQSDITWHGKKPFAPDWSSASSFIACMFNGRSTIADYGRADIDIYIAFNASLFNLSVELPAPPNGKEWKRVIDTSREYPDDFIEEGLAEAVKSRQKIMRKSTLLLISEPL